GGRLTRAAFFRRLGRDGRDRILEDHVGGHVPHIARGASPLLARALGMEIRETTPPEAYETLEADPAAVYLDVRTEVEFEAGHPAGARNVPVVFLDPATRQPTPNPDFVATVERTIPRSTKLLVGCQSGPRSARACGL